MDKTLQQACNDLAPEWIQLCGRVRDQASKMKNNAAGTHLAQDAAALADEAGLLCNHVDRLHADVKMLIERLDDEVAKSAAEAPGEALEIDKASIQIQREAHEIRADVLDVIKALFMWRDDPADRLRPKE
jgi:uncharacterized coiled-coil DUF342 family protein